MARIQVKFGVTQRTSHSGNEYYLIEMFTTDQSKNDGSYKELSDVRLTPFTARLMLEHLPELCQAITEGERLKEQGGPPPQAAPYQESVVGPDSAAPQPEPQQPTQQQAPIGDSPF